MFGKRERTIHIPWRQGDPLEFETYQGQELLKQRLRLRLDAMKEGDQLKMLLSAPFGQGKTSLARTVAYEMFRRNLVDTYIETIGSNFETKADVDNLIQKLGPKTFVFIDEIHTLSSGARESFYLAIQDNVYVYHRQHQFIKLPPGITWVGATTELGKVHPSLQRRLIPMSLEPLKVEDLAVIAQNQAIPVDPKAAVEMAVRCSSPWEIKDELYATAADLATVNKETSISKKTVQKSCLMLGVDDHGLRPVDRRVLDTLHKSPKLIGGQRAFCMARQSLITIAGVDEDTYNKSVEPKLLRKQYITVSSSGRELSGKALEDYYNVT